MKLPDSSITKKALAGALKELMEAESFSKISISDICEKCDMNRKSFYYHFKDKYDLVNWIFDTEFITVMNKEGYTIGWDSLELLSDYFYKNRIFYRKALDVTGQNSFSDHFHDLMFSAISVRLQEIMDMQAMSTFQVNFFTDAVVQAFQRWIMDKNCMPPEEFTSQLKQCIQYIAARYSYL
ncbi:MAG: TetR/AcrR family transcriptional regulator C-terminal domain-containing protein [Eubacteriales bacterium]|nr:TetR/AcrR family transcriptional regulator C-terminal domain-containing protein [Eubacteriales bacterium]